MKRLLLVLALAFVPVALAAEMPDRDVLLTSDGTLYTIESVENDGSAPSGVVRFLQLTIQRPNERPQITSVPESLAAGFHSHPALAYDNESQTVFVFWLKMPNAMSSELLLASYVKGTWHAAVPVDDQPYHLRYNLRIATTHRVSSLQSDGSYRDDAALLIHAIWWEESGYGELARYALFFVRNGTISTIELHNLNEFSASVPLFATDVDPKFNPEILKHPSFVDNGTQNSIDVIFGDTVYLVFNRVRLKPVAEGRIHIPIGVKPVGPGIAVATGFTAPWTGPISTIVSPHTGDLLLYNATKDSVSYILYSGSKWSTVKSVALSDKLSADAAVAALSRMMSQ